MDYVISLCRDLVPDEGTLIFITVCIVLIIYSLFRSSWWRDVLSHSLNYHRYHLEMIINDHGAGAKTKEYAQAMLWSINKQLPQDLGKNRGGMMIWRSFLGDKTCLNTCGTIFYESARFAPYVEPGIMKLNDTLLSTYYRIGLLESLFRPLAVFYMDVSLLVSLVTRPTGGTGRLYREMALEIRKDSD